MHVSLMLLKHKRWGAFLGKRNHFSLRKTLNSSAFTGRKQLADADAAALSSSSYCKSHKQRATVINFDSYYRRSKVSLQ
jgi:hypothetical protein